MRQEQGQQAGTFAMARRDRLLGQARKLCANPTDADDLVQEVIARFIEEFGDNPHLPAEASGEAWLVKTLTHLFYTQCRRQRTQLNRAQDPALSEHARETSPIPACDAITPEQFSEARGTLSPKLHETYELHASGMKYEEIARRLEIPIGTVKKRLHDARSRLRKYLQNLLKLGPP
ncbi:RNA polymerase sigma factor [Stigmatella sp. ncwal1]|uniref:RNA polymerase sigma factor n=1 Tax=Stigmatella ashevillensis TaxID=2995309 RepID=A0ABT5D7I4_9BACT|nr:RNA polymerase sigma factor [Stigmatella ashevillena]MDC0709612.1 RNA polymerase sigma factor [Stigmatella ashevillena]